MGKKKTEPKKRASFEELVSNTSLEKMQPYIKQEVINLGQMLVQNLSSQIEGVYTRLMTIEDIICKEFNMTEDQLAAKVAETEDAASGMVSKEIVAQGDRVRIELGTRTTEEAEVQKLSRMRVEQVGSGKTLGNEIENALIGLKVGDFKEVAVNDNLVCKVVVNRISGIKPEESKNE